MTATLASVPREKRALVTCEGAFSYLARDFGLEERYLWAVNAEGALTPKGVAEVENFVKSRKIPAVFCESTVEGKMKPIVESTDAVYGGTLYVDSLSKAGGPVPSYLDLLRYDSQKIARGLARKGS
jgi:periplasmic solute binding protein